MIDLATEPKVRLYKVDDHQFVVKPKGGKFSQI